MKKFKFLKHLFIMPIIGAPLLAASCNISDQDKTNADLYLSTYAIVLRNDLAPKLQNAVSTPGASFSISNKIVIAAAKKLGNEQISNFVDYDVSKFDAIKLSITGQSSDLATITSNGSGVNKTYTITITRALFLLPITDVNLNVSASLEFKGATFTKVLPPTHELVSQVGAWTATSTNYPSNTDVSYFGQTNGVSGIAYTPTGTKNIVVQPMDPTKDFALDRTKTTFKIADIPGQATAADLRLTNQVVYNASQPKLAAIASFGGYTYPSSPTTKSTILGIAKIWNADKKSFSSTSQNITGTILFGASDAMDLKTAPVFGASDSQKLIGAYINTSNVLSFRVINMSASGGWAYNNVKKSKAGAQQPTKINGVATNIQVNSGSQPSAGNSYFYTDNGAYYITGASQQASVAVNDLTSLSGKNIVKMKVDSTNTAVAIVKNSSKYEIYYTPNITVGGGGFQKFNDANNSIQNQAKLNQSTASSFNIGMINPSVSPYTAMPSFMITSDKGVWINSAHYPNRIYNYIVPSTYSSDQNIIAGTINTLPSPTAPKTFIFLITKKNSTYHYINYNFDPSNTDL